MNTICEREVAAAEAGAASSAAMLRGKCAVCGSRKRTLISGISRYRIKIDNYICMKCGLVYIDPQPTRAEMAEFYAREYRRQYSVLDLNSPFYRAMKTNEAKVLAAYLPLGARVLEIGCASGLLLAALKTARSDVTVLGIEPDNALAEQAKKAYGLEIFCGMFDDFPASGRFDFVIMSHVLEHLSDPLKALSTVHALLRENGRIYIEVPDIRQPYGDFELNFLQQAHLFSFSAKTLTLCLQQSGFSVKKRLSGKCLAVIAYKTPKLRRRAVDFQRGSEEYRRLLRFIRLYTLYHRIRELEPGEAKDVLMQTALRTDVELESRMSGFYSDVVLEKALSCLKRKQTGETLSYLKLFFDALPVRLDRVVDILLLARDLAVQEGDQPVAERWGKLLNGLRQSLRQGEPGG